MLPGESPSRLEQLMLLTASSSTASPALTVPQPGSGHETRLRAELEQAQARLQALSEQLRSARAREQERREEVREARARILGLTDRLRAARQREEQRRQEVVDLRARLVQLRAKGATSLQALPDDPQKSPETPQA